MWLPELLGQRRSQAHAGCHVLAVGDDEVKIEVGAHVGQDMANGRATWFPDDVSDEQAPHQVGAVGHLA